MSGLKIRSENRRVPRRAASVAAIALIVLIALGLVAAGIFLFFLRNAEFGPVYIYDDTANIRG